MYNYLLLVPRRIHFPRTVNNIVSTKPSSQCVHYSQQVSFCPFFHNTLGSCHYNSCSGGVSESMHFLNIYSNFSIQIIPKHQQTLLLLFLNNHACTTFSHAILVNVPSSTLWWCFFKNPFKFPYFNHTMHSNILSYSCCSGVSFINGLHYEQPKEPPAKGTSR